MAFVAEQAFGAHLPAKLRVIVAHELAVFRCILKDLWWSSEVSHVMSVDATFRIVRLLPIWAPARLVSEHVKSKCLQGLINCVQVLIQGWGF